MPLYIPQGQWKAGVMHGKGTCNKGTGETYTGDFKRGLYHGQGTLRHTKGDWYQGRFKRGLRHGKGVMKPSTGGVYTGSFFNGVYHGQGIFKWPNSGGLYSGMWRNGKRWGFGRRVFSSGAEYEGEFADGCMQGRGVHRSAYGDVYTGEFYDNKFHGYGIMVYGKGDRYEGQWQLGQLCGVGKYSYQAGGYYEGEYWALTRGGNRAQVEPEDLERFQESRKRIKTVAGADAAKFHSTLEWQRKHTASGVKVNLSRELRQQLYMLRRSVGRVLVGSEYDNPEHIGIVRPLCDGKRHGRGVRVWADGSRYEGDWYQDKMHGFGVYVGAGPTGQRYEGQWIHGIRSGRGICSWGHTLGGRYVNPIGHTSDGGLGRSAYDGQWVNGHFHGLGKLTNPDGRDYEGEFHHSKRHGVGTQVLLSHETIEYIKQKNRFDALTAIWKYEGCWQHDKRHGVGLVYQLNGDKLHGTFIQGRLHGVVKVMTKRGRVVFKLFNTGNFVKLLTPAEAKEHSANSIHIQATQDMVERRKQVLQALK